MLIKLVWKVNTSFIGELGAPLHSKPLSLTLNSIQGFVPSPPERFTDILNIGF